jgi:hypothetical protein
VELFWEYVGHIVMFTGISLVVCICALVALEVIPRLILRIAIILTGTIVFFGRCISTVVKRRQ